MQRPAFLHTLVRSQPFRVFQLALGVLLIIAAPIVGIPLPGPAGTLIFGLGFALVLRNSRWARRRYLRHTKRYPRVRRVVDFGLRRKPKPNAFPANAHKTALEGDLNPSS
ncbi:MAG: hypothetical protein H7267_01105 [Sandarakinorhabdus sp.]|nr:hypothetical protein [Sandarakinorhabdus sp.]